MVCFVNFEEMHMIFTNIYLSLSKETYENSPKVIDIQGGYNKNEHQPLCIDYPNMTSGIHKLNAKTFIKCINMIPHCHHEYSIAKHISSVLKSIKVFNPITTKSQREKLNSSQQDREGQTSYDPTMLTKPAIHQDMTSQEHER